MRHNSYIKLGADAILFGNATAADVAKGKTFTSAAGVNVTGTAEPAKSNNNVEAYAVTDTSPSVNFKRTDGAIKIWGYGTMTSSGGWGQQTTSLVAFEGDKYHKGAIYGRPKQYQFEPKHQQRKTDWPAEWTDGDQRDCNERYMI